MKRIKFSIVAVFLLGVVTGVGLTTAAYERPQLQAQSVPAMVSLPPADTRAALEALLLEQRRQADLIDRIRRDTETRPVR